MIRRTDKTFKTLFLWVGLMAGFLPVLMAEPLIQSGQTLAFMGDSITQFGAQSPSGYVSLVQSGLAANGIEVKIIPAGISGHKSDQMLARLKGQVLDKKPEWMTLSCGVNDVWHGARGIPLEDYKKNITEIVTQCEAAGVKVMILTSTPINENENDNNKKLADYNAFLKQLAAERKLPLADLSADMWAELNNPTKPRPPGNYLTVDGVHMNPLGNQVMALGVLKAFGLDESQLTKAKESWQTAMVPIQAKAQITLKEYEKLNEAAAAQKGQVSQMLDKTFQDAVSPKAPGSANP
jgi:lysophospholipase L1-like esterase